LTRSRSTDGVEAEPGEQRCRAGV